MLMPRGDATHSNPLAVLGALAGAFGGGGGGEAHGLLAGLGDAASKENEQRIMEQRRAEDEERAGRNAVADQLMAIGTSEDWTPGARAEALRARMELIQNPKAKPEKLMAAVMEASKRERVEAKARNTEREQLTGLSRFSGQFGVPLNPDAVGKGQNAAQEASGQQSVSEDMLALGGGGGGAAPQEQPQQTWWLAPGSSPGIGPGPMVPSLGMPGDAKAAASTQLPEMLAALGPMEEVMQQGPYSPDERQQQLLSALRGQLGVQAEFAKPTRQFTSFGGDGIMDATTGTVLREPTPKAAGGEEKNLDAYSQRYRTYLSAVGRPLSPKEDLQLQSRVRKELAEEARDPELAAHRSWLEGFMLKQEERRSENTPVVQMFDPKRGITIPVPRAQVQDYVDAGWTTRPTAKLSGKRTEELRSADTVLSQIAQIEQIAPKLDVTGPVMGRWGQFVFEKAGGMMQDPKATDLYVKLGKMFKTGLFAEGGKNLTATEARLAGIDLPKTSDTLQTIMVKLRNLKQYTEKYKADTIKYGTTPEERRQYGIGGDVKPRGPNAAGTGNLSSASDAELFAIISGAQ